MKIWTVGHSIRSIREFIALLRLNGVESVADVRRFPRSRRNPQFEANNLYFFLSLHGIHYQWFEGLGGRRGVRPDSTNTAWRSKSFRGYADYMETGEFREQIEMLVRMAAERPTAIMCAEVLWWRCHRALIADYLKARGVTVLHILDPKSVEEHPYTSAAKIINGELSYSGYQGPRFESTIPQ